MLDTPFVQIASISSDRTQVTTTTAPSSFWVGASGQMYAGSTMIRRSAPTSAVKSLSGNVLTFSSAIPTDVQVHDMLLNVNAIGTTVLVEGNTFMKNRAHGVLVKQSNALIQNNHLEGMTGPAAATLVDGCNWMEGAPVSNWTFRSNTIVQSQSQQTGPITPIMTVDGQVPVFANGAPTSNCQNVATKGVFQNITVVGNTITTDFAVVGISIRGALGVTVQSNVLNIPGISTPIQIL